MVLEAKYISAMIAAIAHSRHIEVPTSSFLTIPFLLSFLAFLATTDMKTPTPGILPAKNRIRMQASAIQVYERSLREQAANTVGTRQKILGDTEVKLQSCSVETVGKVVMQQADPI